MFVDGSYWDRISGPSDGVRAACVANQHNSTQIEAKASQGYSSARQRDSTPVREGRMDWLTFTAMLVEVLAWLVAVLLVVNLLQPEVRSLE
jgi:hypothetical protein